MELEKKVQLLEGVLSAVLDRALNTDGLPPAVVRLVLTDAVHTLRELERQLAERWAAGQRAAADKKEEKTDGEQSEA